MKRQNGNPLGAEPIPRLLLKYAVPSIVSMLVMSLYNIVDQIFIGRDSGYLGNGATTAAFPIVTLGLALALLIGNGAAAFISLELGRGNSSHAKKTAGNAFTLLLIAGVALAAVILIFMKPLLRAMGTTDAIMPYAMDYTGIIALGMPFAMMGAAFGNIIRADGSPRYSMFATLSGAVLNTILDPIFIFTFGMGVKGAAIATVISQIVGMAVAFVYVLRYSRVIRFGKQDLRLEKGLVRQVCVLGSSSFITQFAIVIVNVVLNNSLKYYGALSAYGSEIPFAAMGIVLKINAILISVILGIAIGAQPILGFNYGAGNYARVKRTYMTEVIFATALSSIVCLLFMTMPERFIAIIGDPDPVFNEFAARALRTYLSFVFLAGIQIPSANYFQAVGKPVKAMTLSMTRQILVLVPAILILPVFFGLEGILYAMPAADILAMCLTGIFAIRELRHLSTGEPGVAGTAAPAEN